MLLRKCVLVDASRNPGIAVAKPFGDDLVIHTLAQQERSIQVPQGMDLNWI